MAQNEALKKYNKDVLRIKRETSLSDLCKGLHPVF
jgi:hypothetical protein